VATPILTVQGTRPVSAWKGICSIAWRMRSATSSAPRDGVSGSMTTNSSPP